MYVCMYVYFFIFFIYFVVVVFYYYFKWFIQFELGIAKEKCLIKTSIM